MNSSSALKSSAQQNPQTVGRISKSRFEFALTLAVTLIFLLSRFVLAATHSVSVVNRTFEPQNVTIQAGDSVIWTNNDIMPHTVTATDGSFDSDFLAVGAQFAHHFDSSGTFSYICQYHSNMTGVIQVGTSGGGDSSWVELPSPTTLPLNDVRFWNAELGWAAGDQGILRTTNGGESWSLNPTPEDMESVYFINASEGWACGNDGYMIHSTNGGQSWTAQTTNAGDKLRDVWFADANNGWTGGKNGLFFHTTDGGAHWNPQATPIADDIHGINFLDAQTGWICSQRGKVAYTNDGGASWETQLDVPNGEEDDFRAIFMLASDPDHGWVVGEQGRVYHTHNGGTEWFPLVSGTTTAIRDVHFADHDNGLICGAGGFLAQAINEGTQWVTLDPPAVTTFNAVYMVSPGLAFLVSGDGRIFRRSEVISGIDPTATLIPTAVTLATNFPNPFNPATTIEFSTVSEGMVTLKVFDILGRGIATLIQEPLRAGTYRVPFVAADLPSGRYFYQLNANGSVQTRMMTLVK